MTGVQTCALPISQTTLDRSFRATDARYSRLSAIAYRAQRDGRSSTVRVFTAGSGRLRSESHGAHTCAGRSAKRSACDAIARRLGVLDLAKKQRGKAEFLISHRHAAIALDSSVLLVQSRNLLLCEFWKAFILKTVVENHFTAKLQRAQRT